jgi:hypothetical protein
VKIFRFKQLFLAIIFSIAFSLALGFVENSPSASIIGAKSYGYPIAWRTVITSFTVAINYNFGNLIADLGFWFSTSYLTFELIYRKNSGKIKETLKLKKFVIYIFIFLLLALAMDFLHEFGHALWGTVVGGQLTSMQITYFIIYPQLELTSNFQLGYVTVTGLSSFEHGLFLLGGALTTNIVAWFLAIILLKREFGHKTGFALKMLGVIGLLDLPLYVILPQIGLRHWVFLGGDRAEPLIGVREMGISDPIFYLAVLVTSFCLTILYFRPFREKFLDIIRWACKTIKF